MEEKVTALKEWIIKNTPDRFGVLIPISGGSDSALCFWLYNQLFPERVVGVYFGKALRSRSWFEATGVVRVMETPSVIHDPEIARFAVLLDVALAEHRLLVGARNRTETMLGAYSRASRLASHIPLAGVWKSDVLDLCAYIDVPEEIIASSREADPVCGRPEELARLPFAAVDNFLRAKISKTPRGDETLLPEQRAYLENLYTRNRFKEVFPVVGPTLNT
jgi:NH3-dependent NAD+ synthetase